MKLNIDVLTIFFQCLENDDDFIGSRKYDFTFGSFYFIKYICSARLNADNTLVTNNGLNYNEKQFLNGDKIEDEELITSINNNYLNAKLLVKFFTSYTFSDIILMKMTDYREFKKIFSHCSSVLEESYNINLAHFEKEILFNATDEVQNNLLTNSHNICESYPRKNTNFKSLYNLTVVLYNIEKKLLKNNSLFSDITIHDEMINLLYEGIFDEYLELRNKGVPFSAELFSFPSYKNLHSKVVGGGSRFSIFKGNLLRGEPFFIALFMYFRKFEKVPHIGNEYYFNTQNFGMEYLNAYGLSYKEDEVEKFISQLKENNIISKNN